MDVKTITRSSRPPRRRAPGRRNPRVPAMYPNDKRLSIIFYQAAWTNAAIVSSTSGMISSNHAPTIQNSSEYSSISNIYARVRLIAFQTTITSYVPNDVSATTLHNRVLVGYDVDMNATTNTLPTQAIEVENLTRVKLVMSASRYPVTYWADVPPNLEYSLINADAPTLPSPFAGSPGVVKIFGLGFTASTQYLNVHCRAIWQLTSRH